MSFRFTYQKLLEQKKRIEDEAQRDFQLELSLLLSEEKRLVEYELALKNARQEVFEVESRGGSQTGVLNQADHYIDGQKLKIRIQKVKISEQAKMVEKKREILQVAAAEYKIMEKLKENHKEIYKKEQVRRELKQQDELTTMRFNRKPTT